LTSKTIECAGLLIYTSGLSFIPGFQFYGIYEGFYLSIQLFLSLLRIVDNSLSVKPVPTFTNGRNTLFVGWFLSIFYANPIRKCVILSKSSYFSTLWDYVPKYPPITRRSQLSVIFST
jgi:hypothetical protein